jgi:sporulation protein YlmC with PRC-barrel domain
MMMRSILLTALLAATTMTGAALAQSNSTSDPACVIKNADGTTAIDRTKCPDGMKPATSATEADADKTTTTNGGSTAVAPDAAATGQLIVPADRIANAKVMAASDFIGKRVYTRNGDDIGEVNDLIVTDNGAVQAVILGVGGFLGLGEKDVAITMQAIQMQPDGGGTRLVVDASKEQLTNAPDYDRTRRKYLN